jgi:hypothetical protein
MNSDPGRVSKFRNFHYDPSLTCTCGYSFIRLTASRVPVTRYLQAPRNTAARKMQLITVGSTTTNTVPGLKCRLIFQTNNSGEIV